jgi:hypothetical protein
MINIGSTKSNNNKHHSMEVVQTKSLHFLHRKEKYRKFAKEHLNNDMTNRADNKNTYAC